MVGREISELYPARPATPGEVMLEVDGLSRDGYFEDISFSVRRVRSSASPALSVPAGPRWPSRSSGSIRSTTARSSSTGCGFVPSSPRHAVKCGVAYLPENRLVHGLVPTMRVPLNMTMSIWPKLVNRLGVFRTREMNRRARETGRAGRAAGGSAQPARRAPSRVETSRRSCSANGWRPRRGF